MKKTSKSAIHVAAVALCGLLLQTITAPAALVITDGDITGDTYFYDLTFADLNSSAIFNNDVLSQSNVQVFQEGTGTGQRNFVRATAGQTSASFVYAFDFSTTSYLPTSVVFTDRFDLFPSGGDTLTETSEYSLDGTTWNPIRTLTRTTTGTSFGPTTIDLSSQPETVYYRLTFSTSGASFVGSNSQWARMAPTSPAQFSADFTVVPEPGTSVMLGVAVLLFLCFARRIRAGKQCN